ncbi:MLP-like protein 28 [Senna tora]|uniref:MLP-like protein 28 n=1 Tax=Senna tora TaxID=362788 RepID=A0A834WNN0_9FABA|nr:MLP-like protein 28 [Senna tora]
MSHFGKVETDVHINASADKFYELFSSKLQHIGNDCSIRSSIEKHQGDCGKLGSILIWNYVHGKSCVSKDIVEAIDPAKNLITFKVIEGDLLNHYKTFITTIQVSPKEKGSVVHWSYEYEKLHAQIPNPHSLMQLAATMSREMDAHLSEGEGHQDQLVGKIEVDVHMNASAEMFHEIVESKPHHVPNISPGRVHGATMEGDWGKVGSIITWHYTHGGKTHVDKEVVEAIDPKNNLITVRVIEGDLLKEYKSFKITVQAIPKDKGSVVHYTAEYERLKGHIPDPHSLMEYFNDLTKDLDAHLINKN